MTTPMLGRKRRFVVPCCDDEAVLSCHLHLSPARPHEKARMNVTVDTTKADLSPRAF
jgi:hypothetical protein